MFTVHSGCSSTLHEALVGQHTLDRTDMAPAQFELLIKYMYTNHMCFCSVQDICFGLYAAEQFNLHELKKQCVDTLQNAIRADCKSALQVIHLDERFDNRKFNQQLFQQVDSIIQQNYTTILKSDALLNVSVDTMRLLLDLNTTEDVPDSQIECVVFTALLEWTRAQCRTKGVQLEAEELRAEAADLIHLVGYKLMTSEWFATQVIPSQLLDGNTIALVVQRTYNKDLKVPFRTYSRKVNCS